MQQTSSTDWALLDVSDIGISHQQAGGSGSGGQQDSAPFDGDGLQITGSRFWGHSQEEEDIRAGGDTAAFGAASEVQRQTASSGVAAGGPPAPGRSTSAESQPRFSGHYTDAQGLFMEQSQADSTRRANGLCNQVSWSTHLLSSNVEAVFAARATQLNRALTTAVHFSAALAPSMPRESSSNLLLSGSAGGGVMMSNPSSVFLPTLALTGREELTTDEEVASGFLESVERVLVGVVTSGPSRFLSPSSPLRRGSFRKEATGQQQQQEQLLLAASALGGPYFDDDCVGAAVDSNVVLEFNSLLQHIATKWPSLYQRSTEVQLMLCLRCHSIVPFAKLLLGIPSLFSSFCDPPNGSAGFSVDWKPLSSSTVLPLCDTAARENKGRPAPSYVFKEFSIAIERILHLRTVAAAQQDPSQSRPADGAGTADGAGKDEVQSWSCRLCAGPAGHNYHVLVNPTTIETFTIKGLQRTRALLESSTTLARPAPFPAQTLALVDLPKLFGPAGSSVMRTPPRGSSSASSSPAGDPGLFRRWSEVFIVAGPTKMFTSFPVSTTLDIFAAATGSSLAAVKLSIEDREHNYGPGKKTFAVTSSATTLYVVVFGEGSSRTPEFCRLLSLSLEKLSSLLYDRISFLALEENSAALEQGQRVTVAFDMNGCAAHGTATTTGREFSLDDRETSANGSPVVGELRAVPAENTATLLRRPVASQTSSACLFSKSTYFGDTISYNRKISLQQHPTRFGVAPALPTASAYADPNNGVFPMGTFTVELWACPVNLDEYRLLYVQGDRDTEEFFLELYPLGSGVVIKGGQRTPETATTSVSCELSDQYKLLKTWHHFALVMTGDRWLLYLDGCELGSAPAKPIKHNFSGLSGPTQQTKNQSYSVGKSFLGQVAEFRLWASVRSPELLHRDMCRRLSGDEPTLIAYYPLNEGVGNIVIDLARGSHATLQGEPRWLNPCPLPVSDATGAGSREVHEFAPVLHLKSLWKSVVHLAANSGCVALSIPHRSESNRWIVYEYDTGTGRLVAETNVNGVTYPSPSSASANPSSIIFNELIGLIYDEQQKSLSAFATQTEHPHRISHFGVRKNCGSDEFLPPSPGATTLQSVALHVIGHLQRQTESWLLDSTTPAPLFLEPSVSVLTDALLPLALQCSPQTPASGSSSSPTTLFARQCLSLLRPLLTAALRHGPVISSEARKENDVTPADFIRLCSPEALEPLPQQQQRRPSSSNLLLAAVAIDALRNAVSASEVEAGSDLLEEVLTRVLSPAQQIELMQQLHAVGHNRRNNLHQSLYTALARRWTRPEKVHFMFANGTEGDLKQLSSCLLSELRIQFEAEAKMLLAGSSPSPASSRREVEKESTTTAGPSSPLEGRGGFHRSPFKGRSGFTMSAGAQGTSGDDEQVLDAHLVALQVFQELCFALSRSTSNIEQMAGEDQHSSAMSAVQEVPRHVRSRAANVSAFYCLKLLEASQGVIAPFQNAIRKGQVSFDCVSAALKKSFFGLLLPSFVVALPLLPSQTIAVITEPLQQFKELVYSLFAYRQRPSKSTQATTGTHALTAWEDELLDSLAFLMCRIGCMMVVSADIGGSSTKAVFPAETEPFARLLRGGLQKSGTARDCAVRNLVQGVGMIAKVFDELQTTTASRSPMFVPGSALGTLERTVFAAYCNLSVPTHLLDHPTKEGLQTVYQRITKLRMWMMSIKQKGEKELKAVKSRAILLSRLEPAASGVLEFTNDAAAEPDGATAGTKRKTTRELLAKKPPSENNGTCSTSQAAAGGRVSNRHSNRQWRRMFSGWKAMKQVRTLLALVQGERKVDETQLPELIQNFLSSALDAQFLEKVLHLRALKAQQRIAGFAVLRSLLEPTRLHPSAHKSHYIHSMTAQLLAGNHFLTDITGCGSANVSQVRAAFGQILAETVGGLRSAEGHGKSETRGQRLSRHSRYWAELLVAMMATAWKAGDYLLLVQQRVVPHLSSLCSLVDPDTVWAKSPPHRGYFLGSSRAPRCRPNHSLAPAQAKAQLSSCSSSLFIGSTGFVLRWLSGRGSCLGSEPWIQTPPAAAASSSSSPLAIPPYYYYEVTILEIAPGGSFSIGLGPKHYTLSHLPGWDSESCGYHGDEGALFYESRTGQQIGGPFGQGTTIGCGLKTTTQEVFWTRNGKLTPVRVPQFSHNCYPLIGLDAKGSARVNFGSEPFLFDLSTMFGAKAVKPLTLRERASVVFHALFLRTCAFLSNVYHDPKQFQATREDADEQDEEQEEQVQATVQESGNAASRGNRAPHVAWPHAVTLAEQCCSEIRQEIDRGLHLGHPSHYPSFPLSSSSGDPTLFPDIHTYLRQMEDQLKGLWGTLVLAIQSTITPQHRTLVNFPFGESKAGLSHQVFSILLGARYAGVHCAALRVAYWMTVYIPPREFDLLLASSMVRCGVEPKTWVELLFAFTEGTLPFAVPSTPLRSLILTAQTMSTTSTTNHVAWVARDILQRYLAHPIFSTAPTNSTPQLWNSCTLELVLKKVAIPCQPFVASLATCVLGGVQDPPLLGDRVCINRPGGTQERGELLDYHLQEGFAAVYISPQRPTVYCTLNAIERVDPFPLAQLGSYETVFTAMAVLTKKVLSTNALSNHLVGQSLLMSLILRCLDKLLSIKPIVGSGILRELSLHVELLRLHRTAPSAPSSSSTRTVLPNDGSTTTQTEQKQHLALWLMASTSPDARSPFDLPTLLPPSRATLEDTTSSPTGARSVGDARMRMAQDLSVHGFSVDMCLVALEETHYDRAQALRLLNQHHDEFLIALGDSGGTTAEAGSQRGGAEGISEEELISPNSTSVGGLEGGPDAVSPAGRSTGTTPPPSSHPSRSPSIRTGLGTPPPPRYRMDDESLEAQLENYSEEDGDESGGGGDSRESTGDSGMSGVSDGEEGDDENSAGRGSRSSVNSNDSQLSDEGEDNALYEGIQFNGGQVKFTTPPLGPQVTISFYFRPHPSGTSSSAAQVVLHQLLGNGISGLSLHWLDSALHFSTSGRTVDYGSCKATLNSESNEWVHIVAIQDCAELSLYRNGELCASVFALSADVAGDILEGDWSLGSAHDGSGTFSGDVKNFRLWNAVVKPGDRRDDSLVIWFRCDDGELPPVNGAPRRQLVSAPDGGIRISVVGAIEYLSAAKGGWQDEWTVTAEVDVSLPHEPEAPFLIDPESARTSFGSTSTTSTGSTGGSIAQVDRVGFYRKYRTYNSDDLLTLLNAVSTQLATHYGTILAVKLLSAWPENQIMPLTPSAVSGGVNCSSGSDQTVKGFAQLLSHAIEHCDEISPLTLSQSIVSLLRHSALNQAPDIFSICLNRLLGVVSNVNRSSVFESPHPCMPLVEPPREVSFPDTHSYDIFFDQRCIGSHVTITFYADHSLTQIIGKTSSNGFGPCRINAAKFFFDVRVDGTGSNVWGYRMTVQCGNKKSHRAAAILQDVVLELDRSLLYPSPADTASTSAAIVLKPTQEESIQSESTTTVLQRFLRTSMCVKRVLHAACLATGCTRRTLLATCRQILSHPTMFEAGEEVDSSPTNEFRRHFERQYRRECGWHGHSRFVQVTTDFFIAARDAEIFWKARQVQQARAKLTAEIAERNKGSGTDDEPAEEDFIRERSVVKEMYGTRVREGHERVSVSKLTNPTQLRIDANSQDRCIAVWAESPGCSFVADTTLYAGRWYFELKLTGHGDVTIGLVSTEFNRNSALLGTASHSWALNGRQQCFYLEGCTVSSRSTRPWRAKDVIGVAFDIERKKMKFYLNGSEASSLSFAEAPQMAERAVAADYLRDMQRQLSLFGGEGGLGSGVGYTPAILLGNDEAVVVNFGSAHFDYHVPVGYLPLDPLHLSIGSLVPYNQVRAFMDVTTALCGLAPRPPFFLEEANPFTGDPTREGPPHVSLVSDTGINVSQLEARNTSRNFASVSTNCRVLRGNWSFEATLVSQGLMQVGWATDIHSSDPLRGVGVGDTAESWGVDLYRRVRWHNGRSTPLLGTRHWTVGDIVTCNLNIANHTIFFTINGKTIDDATFTDVTIPSNVGFTPAASFRCENCMTFNFGSLPLKYMPSGHRAISVPDTWLERIDTYYSMGLPRTSNPIVPAGVLQLPTTRQHMAVVAAVDVACRKEKMTYHQVRGKHIEDRVQGLERRLTIEELDGMLTILRHYNRLVEVSLPLIATNSVGVDRAASEHWLNVAKRLAFSSVREALIQKAVKESIAKGEHLRITINRLSAVDKRTTGGSGDGMTASVFAQTHFLLAKQHPRLFKSNSRFWAVAFVGEGAEDVGGPFREHLSEMCADLMSSYLPLFVPSPNDVHNAGDHRGVFVPAPSADSAQHLSMYTFIGRLLGGAFRNNEPLNLSLAKVLWKRLVREEVVGSDLETYDTLAYQCITQMKEMATENEDGGEEAEEAFNQTFSTERFVTTLSDGSREELIPRGKATPVTLKRCREYAEAMIQARLNEAAEQVECMRLGLLSVVPEIALELCTAEELERRVCGKPDYNVDELREMTIFEGIGSTDRRVQYLWKALEEGTKEQRRLFLKFVSGRERLPVKLRVTPLSVTGDPDAAFPRAATCFFAIELPDYSSLAVMKEKLYYTIANCFAIDTDFVARDIDDVGDEPQLVGVEDERQDANDDS